MIEWLIVIAWFLGCLFIHETGHVFAAALFNQRTRIRVTWFGMEAGTAKELFAMTPAQNLIVFAMGPLWGAIPFWMIVHDTNNILWVGYWIVCLGDAVGIFQMMNVGKEYFHKPYGEYVQRMLDDAKGVATNAHH